MIKAREPTGGEGGLAAGRGRSSPIAQQRHSSVPLFDGYFAPYDEPDRPRIGERRPPRDRAVKNSDPLSLPVSHLSFLGPLKLVVRSTGYELWVKWFWKSGSWVSVEGKTTRENSSCHLWSASDRSPRSFTVIFIKIYDLCRFYFLVAPPSVG